MPSRSTRREFMKQAGALAAAGAMPALGQARAPGARRPNILFLFPDQHRPDWVQGTPGIPIPTPNLSRLAARATRFDRTLAASPVCAPSRACLASGREYDRCGVRQQRHQLPARPVHLLPPTARQRLPHHGVRQGRPQHRRARVRYFGQGAHRRLGLLRWDPQPGQGARLSRLSPGAARAEGLLLRVPPGARTPRSRAASPRTTRGASA